MIRNIESRGWYRYKVFMSGFFFQEKDKLQQSGILTTYRSFSEVSFQCYHNTTVDHFGKKPELAERTQADTGRPCKLLTERL